MLKYIIVLIIMLGEIILQLTLNEYKSNLLYLVFIIYGILKYDKNKKIKYNYIYLLLILIGIFFLILYII